LKLGAGRVYVGLLAHDAPLLDAGQPELMLRSVGEVLKLTHLSCLALGPGLGVSADAAFYLRCALDAQLPLVIDADALNAIATAEKIKILLKQILTIKVLTPHPAEAARLLGCSTREVQADRIIAATALAHEYHAHVVLKGAGSICASPDQPWRINTSGNPGMASAGMGDVLTGIIAALLAQGAQPQCAMDAAVWLHGAAADACVADGVGPMGLTAGDTVDPARKLLNASLV
jgi:ADP-dependent NAD(P)H-hydrate dehydratase / NAD(P)H-hydrate epimerase